MSYPDAFCSYNGKHSSPFFLIIEMTIYLIRAALIKLFSPFGTIVSEDFLWHTRGPKRGEPRGFAFIQYSTKEVT